MSQDELYGIGPAIHHLPAVRADNERKWQTIREHDGQGLVISWKRLTPAECLKLWAKRD